MAETSSSPSSCPRSAARSISLGALLRTVRYPFVLLSMSVIPALMGDDTYGRYAYFMSIFLILDLACDIGFLQVFGRFVPELAARGRSDEAGSLLRHTLVFALSLSTILVVVLISVHRLGILPDVPLTWILILSINLLLTQSEGILFAYLFGLNRIVHFSAKEILRSALTFGFVTGFYLAGGLQGALWGLVANELVLLLVALWWARRDLGGVGGGLSPSFYRPYFLFGLSFYLPALLFGLMQRSGNMLVKWVLNDDAPVAHFDVANQFLLLVSAYLGNIILSLVPSLSAWQVEQEVERVHRWQRRVMLICGALTFLCFNALLWSGRDVIIAVLGIEYAPVARNAGIAALAIAPMLIGYLGQNYALLLKEPRVYTAAISLGLLVLVTVSLLLLPHFGSAGAAWALPAGYGAFAAVFVLRYGSHFLRTLRDFLLVLLLGAPLLALLAFHGGWLRNLGGLLISSALYIAALILTRLVKPRDILNVIRKPGNPPAAAAPPM